MTSNRPSFLDMPAPAGYVPGLGRGATGFTTRTDIGPARTGSDAPKTAKEGDDDDDEERFRDPENDSGLLVGPLTEDPEDDEADRVYEAIDRRMEERRKAQRDAREAAEREKYEKENPKISAQFKDLKRALGNVSADEWAAIPEVGDLTRRNKRQRQDMERRFYAVPDSVLAGARSQGALDASIETGPGDGTMTDFRSISSARGKVLGLRLEQADGSVEETVSDAQAIQLGAASTIDPRGYLTSLTKSSTAAVDIGDIKRARSLFEALVKTDPKDYRGWIGLTLVEEQANHLGRARTLIQEACEKCPRSEDVWLTNIRLNANLNDNKQAAKVIAASAVRMMPKSVDIWLAAIDLEEDVIVRKRVVQRALEANPASDTLWKVAVNLEKVPSEARLLLAQAVELVPMSEELWLALARLETYKNARKVLSKAGKTLRTSRAVWIAAARLEEQEHQDAARVENIMANAVRNLETEGGLPDRATWIHEAEKCEADQAVLSCRAIIKATGLLGMEDDDDEDKKKTWLADGKGLLDRGFPESARAIYTFGLKAFPTSTALWMATVQLEKQLGLKSGDKHVLWAVLDKAILACPSTEQFWLMYAQEMASSDDVDGARGVLERAFEMNPNNEQIWLAAIELEIEFKSYEKASRLLQRARRDANTEKMWIKSVLFEWQMGRLEKAIDVAVEALGKFPRTGELYSYKGQIQQSEGKIDAARDSFTMGTKACPASVELWLLLAQLEESQGVIIRARSILDRALQVNPRNEVLWVHRIGLEQRAKNTAEALKQSARALQECPGSGMVWSEYLKQLPQRQRRNKVVQAVKECDKDAYLLATLGQHIWAEGKSEKAATWFKRAIEADKLNGDAWMWLYKFTVEVQGLEEAEAVLRRFDDARPTRGLVWPKFNGDVANFGLSQRQILEKAVAGLETPH